MQAEAAASKNENSQSTAGALTQELEQTKQSLKRAREEINLMSKCIQNLKEELEETKKEMKQLLEAKAYGKQPVNDPEIEELKFVEIACKMDKGKRYVKFASPPSKLLAEEVVVSKEKMAEGKPFTKKMRKIKTLIPLIGWLFSSKKSGQEADSLI